MTTVSRRETTDEDPLEATTRFTLEVTERGDGMRVRFADFEVEPFTEELSTTAVEDLASVLPTLDLDIDGYVVGADIEDMIQHLIESSGPLTPAVEARYRSPEFAQHLSQTAGNRTWTPWVELWLDLELQPGETNTFEDSFTLGDGSSVPLPMEWHHDGAAEDGTSVELQWQQIVEGDAFERGVSGSLSDLTGTNAPAVAGSLVREVSAVMDPRSPRPTTITAVETTSIEDGPERVDQRVSTFDWEHAEGC